MEATKTYSPGELIPSTPIHPGEVIKDELEARSISQRKFSSLIGCSYTVLNEILNGKRPLTTDYALRIEAALNIKAYILANMQSDYNLQTAKSDSHTMAILNKIRATAAML